MDFSQLTSIYPSATLAETPSSSGAILALPYGKQWIHIEKKQLSTTEEQLLSSLFSTNNKTASQLSTHSWYEFLWKTISLPKTYTGAYRVIQFEIVTKEPATDLHAWLDAFQSAFDLVDDGFFINEHYGILVQKYGAPDLSYEEIGGVLQALEDDFSVKAVCYLGQYWQLSTQFSVLFNEEKAIFTQQKNQLKGLTVLSLSQTALSYYVKSATDESKVINELKQSFSTQLEWQELVRALWETQGNISMAAKSLYVHRNTLQYRIDRFTEATGFSLKNRDDLMLCYLLLL